MRIAICDDNRQDMEMLRAYLLGGAESYVIDCFESGESFISEAKKSFYDLVFMDIYLPDQDGISVIRKLRDIAPKSAVVFTTVSDSHAVDAFSVRAIHYLIKPYTKEDVAEAMKRVNMKNMADLSESLLTVRIGNEVYTLNQHDIVRVEAQDHKVNIFMINRSVYSIWMSFSRAVEQLDSSFLCINRGICINMRHVVRWRSYDCEMRDGMKYLLNSRRRKQLKEAYFNWKMSEMREAQENVTKTNISD